MTSITNGPRILAEHHDRMEHALTAVRMDHTLDDRQKSRLITQMIAAANARAIEIVARHRRHAAVGAFEAAILERTPLLSH